MDAHLTLDRPSDWVVRFAPWIPPGEVLDLACGSGRHSRLLAALGRQVLAVDRNADALAQVAGAGIATLQADLERDANGASWPFEPERFSGVVVTNYLFRPLLPAVVASLKPGGVLIYETFAAGNAQFGKPSNPDFLLHPGELLALAQGHGLRVGAYEEGYVATPREAVVQRIAAIKPPVIQPVNQPVNAPANETQQERTTLAGYPLQSTIHSSTY